MRFLHHPEDLIRNKHQMMFFSSAFAIGAAVVGVVAAGASAAVSINAANQAAKRQAAASRGVRNALGQIEGPTYDVGSMIADAARISAAQRAELEKFQPGAAALRGKSVGQINKAMDVTDQYLRGEIPQDVREQTMRNIAEFGGAGFNPETAGQAGGFQVAQGLVPRQFGLTSLDLQRQGLEAIPRIQGTAQSWQQLARAFTADPLAVGELQYRYAMGGAEIDMAKATGVYSANKDSIAASYAAQQATAQGISDIGKATSTGLGSMSNINAAQQGLGSYGGYGQPMQQNQQLQYSQLGPGTQVRIPQYTPNSSDRPVPVPTSQGTYSQVRSAY
jgi:hypothetical protein